MKTPPAPSYHVTHEDEHEDWTERTIECTTCASFVCGFDRWLGGTVSRPTHLLVLRDRLRAQCRRADCPQPKEASFHG